MDTSTKNSMLDYEVEESCPVCGKHLFTSTPYLKNREQFYSQTVLWCKNGRGSSRMCNGKICYCKKCEKYYPESEFGFHNDAYECKECGQVQWDYTEIKSAEKRDYGTLNRIRYNIDNLF